MHRGSAKGRGRDIHSGVRCVETRSGVKSSSMKSAVRARSLELRRQGWVE
jgi:hypothetical protein